MSVRIEIRSTQCLLQGFGVTEVNPGLHLYSKKLPQCVELLDISPQRIEKGSLVYIYAYMYRSQR